MDLLLAAFLPIYAIEQDPADTPAQRRLSERSLTPLYPPSGVSTYPWMAQKNKAEGCQQLSCELGMLRLHRSPQGAMFHHGIQDD